MRIIRKSAKKTFSNIRKAAKKNFSRDVNEIWDAIIENGIATEDECQLVTDINGYSERSLNDIIYARTGFRSMEQYKESEGMEDFACGSKGKKKFASSQIKVVEESFINDIYDLERMCWGQAKTVCKTIREAGFGDELMEHLAMMQDEWDSTELNDYIAYEDVESEIGMLEEEEEEEEEEDFACGSKNKKKFADEKQLDKFYNKHLTREEAIEAVGIDKVEEVERENCEYRGQSDVYEEEYWTNDVDIDNDGHFLRIVYTVPEEAFYREDGEAIEDLGELDWEGYIDYYELY